MALASAEELALRQVYEELRAIKQQLQFAGVNWIRFPKDTEWDVQTITLPTAPLVLPPKKKVLIATDKDLVSPYGWIFAGTMTANSRYAGIQISYRGPKGRQVTWDLSIEDLYNQGLTTPAPGSWTVTRWAEATPPEYAIVLPSSFYVPYQPEGMFYVQNKSNTDTVTIYSLLITLIAIF